MHHLHGVRIPLLRIQEYVHHGVGRARMQSVVCGSWVPPLASDAANSPCYNVADHASIPGSLVGSYRSKDELEHILSLLHRCCVHRRPIQWGTVRDFL